MRLCPLVRGDFCELARQSYALAKAARAFMPAMLARDLTSSRKPPPGTPEGKSTRPAATPDPGHAAPARVA